MTSQLIPKTSLVERAHGRYIKVKYGNFSDSFKIDELKFLTDGTYYINNESINFSYFNKKI